MKDLLMCHTENPDLTAMNNGKFKARFEYSITMTKPVIDDRRILPLSIESDSPTIWV